MDPLSITVGALGITEFALSSIDKLRNFINDLAEAKEVVLDIASTLEAIQRPLAALQELKISDSAAYTVAKEDLKKTGVADAVNKCGQACADINKKLEQWTRHSSSTKLSLRDRLSVGVWNKEKIQTFRTQIQSCQATVQFAVTSTQLWANPSYYVHEHTLMFRRIVQYRSDHASVTDREELKKQVETLRKAIEEHIDLTKRQQNEAQRRKEELQEAPEDEEDDGAQRTLAISEVEERSLLLEADQRSNEALSSQLRSRLSGQESGNTYRAEFGDYNSGMQIGYSAGTVTWTSNGNHN